MSKKGAVEALLAAILFGISAPVIKLMFSDISPGMLAGLLNLGSGGGLVLWLLVKKRGRVKSRRSLGRKDMEWLAWSIGTGGIAAPVLLMYGLARSTGSAASLLLNTEAAFTALLAWLIFQERLSARVWIGLAAVTLGSTLLTWAQAPHGAIPLGGLAVAGACFMWGLDNNFTRRISDADPAQITAMKGLFAGTFNVLVSIAMGNHMPAQSQIAGILTLGFFTYGISLTLFVAALRELGAGRTAGYFAIAPFVGAALSILILHEPLTIWLLSSAALMVPGVWLLLTEVDGGAHSETRPARVLQNPP